MKPSNVYIETYGCQMNKLDSENAAAILEKEGFNTVQDITLADVILLNTCGVRENAEIRIHGRVAELSSLKKERPEIIFGIIGCMAQRLERSLLSDTVKIVAGP
ncbi:MAG: tRNA (N6-isopentenyl adenosine(37)-C2)-methylthiotransferase MiaB, partial [Candidatus Latescibacteria bacterium]|nr:tRNA (N6-isopentenyl adenosine(37)-C2)-methylthiotransferase MiaB [Candidatus Latescibacterota bacterium]